MINKAKVALILAIAMAPLAATSALAEGFDLGNVLQISSRQAPSENSFRGARVHTARRNGMESYAMDPRERAEPMSSLPSNSDQNCFGSPGSLNYTPCTNY